MTHPTDDDLVLYYYAEGDGLPDAREHLSQCQVCAERLAALENSLALVSASSVPERDDQYGRTVWARIRPQLEEGRAHRWGRWLQAGLLASPRLALAGGVAALVLAAFVAGRNWPTQTPAPTATTSTTTAAAADALAADGRQRVLYGAVGDHLERSAMVLAEFANRGDAGSTDISGEQIFTGNLVASNRLYRQSATRQGEAGLASVLEQLERILVEITNSPSQMSAAQLQDLRQRIDDQGLLFKIRILEEQARQRQRETTPATPKPTATKS
jgi:hypothetical protein